MSFTQAQPQSEEAPPSPPTKQHPGKGLKRPRRYTPTDDDVPDLGRFFEDYDLGKKAQIAVCRTYANHLAAALRSIEDKD